MVFAFLGYYILGDVILNEMKVEHKAFYYFLIAVIMFALTFFTRFLGMGKYWLFNAYTSFFSPTITVASICIFIGVKQIEIKKDFSWLSGKTFCIYVFHTIVYNAIFNIIENINFEVGAELGTILLVTIATFFVSLVLAVIYDAFWTSKSNWKKRWSAMKIWNIISEL